jgi:hypothetical protein
MMGPRDYWLAGWNSVSRVNMTASDLESGGRLDHEGLHDRAPSTVKTTGDRSSKMQASLLKENVDPGFKSRRNFNVTGHIFAWRTTPRIERHPFTRRSHGVVQRRAE